MIVFPYSTALSLARPTWASYAAALLCVLVYTLQLGAPITATLAYDPASWNPIRMVSASFAHAGFWHLFGNLVFFMAFAPALEILIGNLWRYLGLMLFVALVTGVGYSLAVALGGVEAAPTIGFSGIVMGMIGLAAYLMPQARIRVFFWLIVWKTFFVPAWILAAIYIGLDAWSLLTAGDYGGVNLVAHVAGGLAGYAYGRIWLQARKAETSEELAEEIEAMRLQQRYGRTRAEAYRYKRRTDPLLAERERRREEDRFMGRVYQMVNTGRDGEAIAELLSRYDEQTLFTELEPVFERAGEWGASRTLLCLGRLLVAILDREQRYGRALYFIERCQAASPGFVLPDLARTLFYAQMALDTGKPAVARGLVADADRRYAGLVNPMQCNHLLQKTR